jgi:hypothetical protein
VRGLDHGNWRWAYNAICIPALTYGAPVWYWEQKKHINTLQRVQNAAIGIISGAFRSAPREPLHQLTAILPINIHLKKLVSQAAIWLLSLPTNSPVLHRLGHLWSSEQGSGVPLPSPLLLTRPPLTCIRRLAKQVSTDSRRPPTFDNPPWRRCLPPPNRFEKFYKGKDRKKLVEEITKSHHSRADQLLIYCRSLGPNPTQTLPMWTAACVAFQQNQEVGHRVTLLGQNASARDAAFHAVSDGAGLAKDLLAGSPSPSVTILSTDHFVLPYFQITDRHDNAVACRAICDTVAATLSTHPTAALSIRLGTRQYFFPALQTSSSHRSRGNSPPGPRCDHLSPHTRGPPSCSATEGTHRLGRGVGERPPHQPGLPCPPPPTVLRTTRLHKGNQDSSPSNFLYCYSPH